jgi:hypothetical protein
VNTEKNTNQLISQDESEAVRPKYNFDKYKEVAKKIGMTALLLLMVREGVVNGIHEYQDKTHSNIIATEKFTFYENEKFNDEVNTVVEEMATENNIDARKILSPNIGSYDFDKSVHNIHADGRVQPGDEFSVKLIKLSGGEYTPVVEEVAPNN